jgi:hypothetical protein
MSAKKHDAESEGVKSRDHAHPRHHFLRHAHKDWRVWAVVLLMLAMMLVYVRTVNQHPKQTHLNCDYLYL